MQPLHVSASLTCLLLGSTVQYAGYWELLSPMQGPDATITQVQLIAFPGLQVKGALAKSLRQ